MRHTKLHLLYAAARLDELLATLDELHTAASDNSLETLSPRGKAELIGWLQDVAYTATETIAELQKTEPHQLRLVQGAADEDGPDDRDRRPYKVVVVAGDTPRITPFPIEKRARG